MARTLGSEEANQVTKPGRRVLIGWTGPADNKAFRGHGSAQSLPRVCHTTACVQACALHVFWFGLGSVLNGCLNIFFLAVSPLCLQTSALHQELSLAKDRSLLQSFVPELQKLRKDHQHTTTPSQGIAGGLQAEVRASFPTSCGDKGSKCSVSVAGDSTTAATVITLW